jgi:diacylglycerol O-acyltransferase / wax synthase
MQSMSTLDSLFLHVENEVSHMHLGAVALFDGPAPSEGELAALVAGRLALLARYRQRVRLVPGGLGRPVWVEDPHFQLGYHLRHTALPSPGGTAQLRQLVGRVMAQPLDRRRPLWEMWLFEGADADRWGLICKLHHCMVDGIAAGDLLGVLLSPEPGTAPSVPDDWQPRPEPSSASVLAHTLGKYTLSGAAQHVRTARALLGAPGHTARRAATLTGGLISLRGPAGTPTARSLNGPLRAERQWVQARARLADVKTIRRALGGTVNDVLLAAVSGGFRALLQQRGESLPDELIVRTLVPLSLRTPDARGIPDNRVSALIAELPIGLKDPVERLQALTIQLDALKRSPRAASTLTALAGLAPPPLLALGARALARAPQRRLQTVTTNVPGPQQPLYLCGRRMLEIFPYVPLALDVRIGVAICSYDGTLGFGVTGDGQHATDIPILAGGIEHELAQLLDRATPTAPPGTPSAKPHASSNAIAATPPNVGASPAPTHPETRQAAVRSAAHSRPAGARRPSRPPRSTPGRRTRTASPSRNPGSPLAHDASPEASTPSDIAGADRGAEFSRDHVGRQLSQAVDARRRLTAQRRGPTETSTSRFGPRDPRYDYLSRSHD